MATSTSDIDIEANEFKTSCGLSLTKCYEEQQTFFDTTKTHDYYWRVLQLETLILMCKENKQELQDALMKDLGKCALVSNSEQKKPSPSISQSATVLRKHALFHHFER
jgi:hypothetical protein